MPIVYEEFAEFSQRHGDKPLRIKGRLLFPDGARCDLSDVVRQEPPEKDFQRLNLCREYAQEMLQRARDDFRYFVNVMNGSVGGIIPPDPIAAAKELKSVVDCWSKKMIAIDRALSQTSEAVEMQKRREIDQQLLREQMERQATIQSELLKITIDH